MAHETKDPLAELPPSMRRFVRSASSDSVDVKREAKDAPPASIGKRMAEAMARRRQEAHRRRDEILAAWVEGGDGRDFDDDVAELVAMGVDTPESIERELARMVDEREADRLEDQAARRMERYREIHHERAAIGRELKETAETIAKIRERHAASPATVTDDEIAERSRIAGDVERLRFLDLRLEKEAAKLNSESMKEDQKATQLRQLIDRRVTEAANK